jgi:hypothetical protein
MAFILNDLLSSLDSSIGLLDSSSDLLEILQAINVTNPAKGYGKSRRKTYDSFAALPPASADFRGTFAVVQTVGNYLASANNENGLYLCDGSEWSIVEELDSVTLPPIFQGTNFGYVTGGASSNVIQKFPFASDGNATDVGDLTTNMFRPSGSSSQTHGYASNDTIINKFSFTTDGNATTIGNLAITGTRAAAGQSSAIDQNGYVTGGGSPSTNKNTIQKFPFSADTNATDIGDLTTYLKSQAGCSSQTHGYSCGGVSSSIQPAPSANRTNRIDQFPFASDANATYVGNLSETRSSPMGQSSSTHGYNSGGYSGSFSNRIDKFPFASNGTATDVGDLTVARELGGGQSSTVSGYGTGGLPTPGQNVIDKFPFATDANATDVGDLFFGSYHMTGQQF